MICEPNLNFYIYVRPIFKIYVSQKMYINARYHAFNFFFFTFMTYYLTTHYSLLPLLSSIQIFSQVQMPQNLEKKHASNILCFIFTFICILCNQVLPGGHR